ncbi:hypothetical protein DFQ28_001007, partial [Apophysomyces sp. BC1034]
EQLEDTDNEDTDNENTSNEDTSGEDTDNEQEISDQDFSSTTVITIPSVVPVPQLKEITATKVESYRRSYDDAIFFACQQEQNNDPRNTQTKRTIEALDLQPFSIVNEDGVELNALAHPKVIAKAVLL